jgi:hypothetical protein
MEDDVSSGPNPWVRNSNTPGAYDEDKAGTRTILRISDNDWRMWWEAVEGIGDPTTLAYATSSDAGTSWTKYGSNPILSPNSAPNWENNEIAPTCVIWDPVLTKFLLYYHGGWDDPAGGYPNQVGLLYSSDGITWTREATNPVISNGAASSDDEDGCNDASVVRVSATEWIMLYQGENSSGKKHILRATSTDGISWTKDTASGIVLDVGSGGSWDDNGIPAISKPIIDGNGRWHCWYNGDDGTPGPFQYEVGYAYSDDQGQSFTKGSNNPVLSANSEEDSPDSDGASDVFWVVNDGDKLIVTYTGTELTTYTGSGGYPIRAICGAYIPYAVSSTPAIPGRFFESAATRPQVALDTGLNLLDDLVYTVAVRFKCYEDDVVRHLYTEEAAFNEQIYFRLTTGGELEIYHRTPTAISTVIDTGTRVDDNVWHNVAMRRNASGDFDIVLDGSTVASDTANDPGSISVSPDIAYGNWHEDTGEPDQPLLGTIARIAVWEDDALTDAEIEAFLTSGTEPSAGEATWWHDPGTSSPETDLTSTSNTGTIQGTTVVNADPAAGFDSVGVSVQVETQDLVIDSTAPSVATGSTVAVEAIELVLGAQAPTVTTTTAVTVNALGVGLAISLQPVTVTTAGFVTADVQGLGLLLSAQAPTVTTSSSVITAVSAAELVLGAEAPSVTTTSSVIVEASASELVLSAQAPTVTTTTSATVAADALELVLGSEAPAVTTTSSVTVTVDAAELVLGAQASTATTGSTVTADASELVIGSEATTVQAAVVASAAVSSQDLVLGLEPATVSGAIGATAAVSSLGLVLSEEPPSITADRTVTVLASAKDILLGLAPASVDVSSLDVAAPTSQTLVLYPAPVAVTTVRHVTVVTDAIGLVLGAEAVQVQAATTSSVTVDSTSLVLSSEPATASTGSTVAADSQELVLSAQPSVVTIASTTAVDALGLVFSSQPTTVITASTVTARALALVLGVEQVTVDTVTASVGTPDALGLVLSAEPAVVTTSSTVTLDAIGLVFGAEPATIAVASTIAVGATALVLSVQQTSVTTSAVVTADAASLVLSAGETSVTTTRSVTVQVGATTMSLGLGAVSAGASVSATTTVESQTLELSVQPATATAIRNASVEVDSLAIDLSGEATSISTGSTATVDAAAIELNNPGATISVRTVAQARALELLMQAGSSSVNVSTQVSTSALGLILSPEPSSIYSQFPGVANVGAITLDLSLGSAVVEIIIRYFSPEEGRRALPKPKTRSKLLSVDPLVEIENLEESHFSWMGLRVADRSLKCECTRQPGATQGCKRCLGTGFGYVDQLAKGYTWVSNEATEFYTKAGRISTQVRHLVLSYDRPIKKFDQVLILDLDPDTGQPIQPYSIRRSFTVSDATTIRGSRGRLTFWKCTLEEQTFSDNTPGEKGTGYTLRSNR